MGGGAVLAALAANEQIQSSSLSAEGQHSTSDQRPLQVPHMSAEDAL